MNAKPIEWKFDGDVIYTVSELKITYHKLHINHKGENGNLTVADLANTNFIKWSMLTSPISGKLTGKLSQGPPEMMHWERYDIISALPHTPNA